MDITSNSQELERLRARVAELERDRQAFRAAEQELRLQAHILDQIHDAAIETDLVGTIVRWNRGAQSLYGYTAQEAVGQHVSFLHPPTARESMRVDVLQALLESGSREMEGIRIRKNGEAFIAHVSLSVLNDEHGKPYGMVGYSTDITNQRRAEDSLRKSEEKYRTLVETTNTGYVILDTSGIILDANAEYVRLTGRRALHDVIGHSVLEWTAAHDVDRNKAEVLKTLERGFVRNFEVDYVNLRGERVPIEVNATLFQTENGPAIVGLCRNISERRRASEMQQRLLSEVDHRVRNNLASLAALIDISRQNKKTVADFASAIRNRVQAMATVHSLLSRARWQAIDLSDLIRMLLPLDLHDRVLMNGPEALITPRQATAMGMMLQELAANSLKHGSLCQPGGKVELNWSIQPCGAERTMNLEWRESDGKPIEQPLAFGQGTALITGFGQTELRGRVDLSFPREGAHHHFCLLLDAVDSEWA